MIEYNENRIDISLAFVDNEHQGLIGFNYDLEHAEFKLNVVEWARLSGVDVDLALYAFEGNENIPDVGVARIDVWESPSQYFEDPGDGGYTFEVSSIIGESDLHSLLKEYMGYVDDILDKESADKLLEHVHEISTEMDKYEGYVDDSNK